MDVFSLMVGLFIVIIIGFLNWMKVFTKFLKWKINEELFKVLCIWVIEKFIIMEFNLTRCKLRGNY